MQSRRKAKNGVYKAMRLVRHPMTSVSVVKKRLATLLRQAQRFLQHLLRQAGNNMTSRAVSHQLRQSAGKARWVSECGESFAASVKKGHWSRPGLLLISLLDFISVHLNFCLLVQAPH